MPTIVKLALKAAHDGDPLVYEDIDLDALTPRARALAEAVAQRSLATPGEVWCAAEGTVRQLVPDAERWYSSEELDQPLTRNWSGWSYYPPDSVMPAADYLEQQARRIPPGYAIIGHHPDNPVPSAREAAQDTGMTRDQVLDYLEALRGKRITPGTWSAYVARDQAPKPVRYVGRTPLWDRREIAEWAKTPEAKN